MSAAAQPKPHATIKHRIIAWLSQTVFDRITYTSRQGLTAGMKRRGGLGWVPALASRDSESAEERFWRTVPLAGLVVYDVGAFHGLLTLFIAKHARAVVAYEPNSRNRARLGQNVEVNALANVTIRPLAVGSRAGEAVIVFSNLLPGEGSVDPAVSTRIRNRDRESSEERIRITTIDEEIGREGLPVPDLIKIDIEGFELEALRGARVTLMQHAPALFLELHGATLTDKQRNVRELVEHLESVGYRHIMHVESGAVVTAATCEATPEGHLYCSPAVPLPSAPQ